jgi:alpha-N-arabinofuranosidase
MRSGVAAGLGLNLFNRQAAKLHMCNIAQIVNVLQSLLITDGADGTRCVRTTTYYAFLLFKEHRGNMAVYVENGGKDPLGVSVSATRAAGKLVVSLATPRTKKRSQLSANFRELRHATPPRASCTMQTETPPKASTRPTRLRLSRTRRGSRPGSFSLTCR